MTTLPFSASHDTIQKNILEDVGLTMYEMKDLKIKKHGFVIDTKTYRKIIESPAILIDINEPWYHFWFDFIAQFLLIAEQKPGAEVFFVNTSAEKTYEIQEDLPPSFEHVRYAIRWLKRSGYNTSFININDYQEIIFKSVCFYTNRGGHGGRKKSEIEWLEKLLSEDDDGNGYVLALKLYGEIIELEDEEAEIYIRIATEKLRSFIIENAIKDNRLPKNFEYPRKVYLYPGGKIRKYARQALIHPSLENNLNLDVSGRLLPLKDLDQLDEFFVENEYSVFDPPKNHNWLDVLNIIINADYVACYASASVINLIVAKESAQVIYISPHTIYEFPHQKMIRSRHKFLSKSPKPIIIFNRYDLKKVFPYQKEFKEMAFGYSDVDSIISNLKESNV